MTNQQNNKYLNGKIYKIVSDYTDDVYIGSTIKTLKDRLRGHKRHFKSHMNGKFPYMTSFELLKYAEYRIELVELYPCANKKALESREGYWIKNNDNAVNKYVVGRTRKETYKAYRESNKDKIKEYHQMNKDKISKQKKAYYQTNKDKINEYKSEKITCDCGTQVCRSNIIRHKKTKNHANLLQQIEQLKQENTQIQIENDYYRARIQDLIDQVTNDSLVDDEYQSILDSEIDTILSSLSSLSD